MKKKRQAPKGGGSGRRGGRRSSGGGAVSMEVDALHGTADVSDGGRLALDDLRQWSIRGDHQHGEANGGSPARNRRRGKAHQRAQGLPAHAQPRRRSRRGSCGKDDTSARAKRRGGKTRAPSEKHAVDPLWGLLSTGSSGGSDGSDVQDYVQNTQDNMLDMETLAAAVEQAHLSALPTADVKTSSSDDETDSGAESNTEFVEFDDLFPRIDPLNFNGPAELAAVSTSLSAALNKLRQLVPDLTSSAESPRQRQKAFALAAEIQSIGHRLDDTVREMARASHAAPGQGDGAGLLHGSGAPSAAAAAAAGGVGVYDFAECSQCPTYTWRRFKPWSAWLVTRPTVDALWNRYLEQGDGSVFCKGFNSSKPPFSKQPVSPARWLARTLGSPSSADRLLDCSRGWC
eukprot:m.230065 g.230065  ORF g.230065 m.230065 type:complete len:401 (-) comp18856_c4_seq8:22-1224(-)